jgi:hypothetical protein
MHDSMGCVWDRAAEEELSVTNTVALSSGAPVAKILSGGHCQPRLSCSPAYHLGTARHVGCNGGVFGPSGCMDPRSRAGCRLNYSSAEKTHNMV